MYATLFGALASLALWAFLLATLPPSGWLHLPLAVGTTLLVRWIAVSDGATVNGTAAGRPDPT